MVKKEWYTERMSEQVKAEEGRGEGARQVRGRHTLIYLCVSRWGRESQYAPYVGLRSGWRRQKARTEERKVGLSHTARHYQVHCQGGTLP